MLLPWDRGYKTWKEETLRGKARERNTPPQFDANVNAMFVVATSQFISRCSISTLFSTDHQVVGFGRIGRDKKADEFGREFFRINRLRNVVAESCFAAFIMHVLHYVGREGNNRKQWVSMLAFPIPNISTSIVTILTWH
jgi:hypothetical protein